MRVKKTLPGLILGKRATALPPLEERSVVLAKGQAAMSGQLSGNQSKQSLASGSKKKLINANSEREIVHEMPEASRQSHHEQMMHQQDEPENVPAP